MRGKREMKIDKDTLIFSTGKETYANLGIVGLGNGHLSSGYDDGLGGELTDDEIKELAAYMIEAWKAVLENPSMTRW